MDKELKAIFESIDSELFTEDTLAQISTLVEEKIKATADARVRLELESALQAQDEDHTAKFQQAVKAIKESIDKDHTAKVKFVVESINKDHTEKLNLIKSRYEKIIKEDAIKNRDVLVESVNTFFEAYLDKTIPAEQIQEAAKNKYTAKVLEEARKVLGVDEKFVKQNIKEAVVDGKKKLDALYKENQSLKNEKLIKESQSLLIEKTANLPADVAKFVRKSFANKPADFIKENFQFVIDLYDRREKNSKRELLNTPKKQNVDRAKVADDLVRENSEAHNSAVSNENPTMDLYMEGMTFGK